MHLVQFFTPNGHLYYLNPAHVVSVSAGYDRGTVNVQTVNGMHLVRGTVEEVVAKLNDPLPQDNDRR